MRKKLVTLSLALIMAIVGCGKTSTVEDNDFLGMWKSDDAVSDVSTNLLTSVIDRVTGIDLLDCKLKFNSNGKVTMYISDEAVFKTDYTISEDGKEVEFYSEDIGNYTAELEGENTLILHQDGAEDAEFTKESE